MGRPEPRESKWRNDHVFVIRRIVVMAIIVIILAASIVSTITSGHAVEAARTMQQSQIDQPRNSINGNAASNDRDTSNTADSSSKSASTTNSQSNVSSDSKKPSDNNSNDTNIDPKASDIEKTLAADKTAQPLTDAQKSAIFERAKQTAQTATAASGTGSPVTYTYCLQTKGNVGNATAFANAVYATLNDPQGWPRAGAIFEQMPEDACASADMAIILSEAQYLPTFSSYCSVQYSCRVGQEVIVNDDRWNGAVDAWLDAGGTLSRYRQMVINHEVGHRLGHIDNETTCAGAGQRAPLMQEQSMHLDGCVPNEWPLDNELWIG